MQSSTFVEDIFLEFFHLVEQRVIPIQRQDFSVAQSFYLNILSNVKFTENQGKFVLTLLQKYRNFSQLGGLDYSESLESPQWKNSFRVIDYSRKVFAETDETGNVWVCAKFPFQLKKMVDDEICKVDARASTSIWDHERKIRKFNVNDYNVVQIFEFAKANDFEIEESFFSLLSEIEEIWQNQEEIQPRSEIINGEVRLVNAPADALEFWNNNKTQSASNNLFLAKSMGYKLVNPSTTPVEKIAASDANMFWIKTNKEFLEITKLVDGKVCIVLDRVGRTLEWLTSFAKDLDDVGIDHSLVKVCFRASKNEDQELNDWIKDSGFGGKVDDGKILIFNHKPAKWLFKNSDSVKILASNNLYPSTNQISRDWFGSHSCVIYIGDIKPSQNKEQKIVDL